MATSFYDPSETRDPAEREAALMAALSGAVAAAQRSAPAYRERLAGIDAAAIDNRHALAELPLTRKSELAEMQRRNPPFGGFTTLGIDRVARVFASPGPIYEIEPRRPDFFRMAMVLGASACLRKPFTPAQLMHVVQTCQDPADVAERRAAAPIHSGSDSSQSA